MRQVVKDFAAIVSGLLPIEEPVYEFGALRVGGQEDFADLRPLFAGKNVHRQENPEIACASAVAARHWEFER